MSDFYFSNKISIIKAWRHKSTLSVGKFCCLKNKGLAANWRLTKLETVKLGNDSPHSVVSLKIGLLPPNYKANPLLHNNFCKSGMNDA
jgi:hypothetical protein